MRRLRKPQLEGWHGPRQKTGKKGSPSPTTQGAGGWEGGISDRSKQAVTGKVAGKQDLASYYKAKAVQR